MLESLKHAQAALAVFGASSELKVNPSVIRVASLPVFGASGGVAVNAHVIRHSRTKHGPRGTNRSEYAQAAIFAVLYPDGVPDNVSDSKLWRQVKRQLGRDLDYCAKFGRDARDARDGKISRQTVARARVIGRAANS